MAHTHPPMSRQRKYQLRMRRHKRCVECGRPLAQGSRSMCLKHVIDARERQRRKQGFNRRYHNTLGYNPQLQTNGGESAASGGKTWPVQFTYQADGIEVAASMSGHGEMTRPGLTTLLQTFLTSLTWMCSTNCSSTEGWLALTMSDKRSLWRVTRSAGDSSSLRLVPVSGKMPAVLRGAARPFCSRNGSPDRQPAVARRRLGQPFALDHHVAWHVEADKLVPRSQPRQSKESEPESGVCERRPKCWSVKQIADL